MTHRIAVLVPYFGPWPAWMNFFVESCRSNSDIDWLVIGDSAPPENRARNVKYLATTLADYRQLLSEKLRVKVPLEEPYKICDLRPALAFVHADMLGDYDFVGFGDLDVIYGDIRAFYDDETLERFDLLSSHADRVSGHFCLMRNTPEMVTAFERAPGWKDALRRTDNLGFDERGLFNLFRPGRRSWLKRAAAPAPCLFREAYSTPGPTEHMRWYWKDGRLTNEYYPYHPFMYLHFMSWQSNRWYGGQPGVSAGAPAPWSRLPELVQMDWRDARKEGFMISPTGIQPIERPHYP